MDKLNSVSAAPSAFKPTQLSRLEQDPLVGLPVETVTLDIQKTDANHIASKDFKLNDPVVAAADGSYGANPNETTELKQAFAVSTLASAQRIFDTFTPYCDNLPKNWLPLTSQLQINSFDRKDEPNAFFNPMPFPDHGHIVMPGTHFGYFKDPKTGDTISAAASSEVTSHEVGHAILNRFRPNYFHATGPEPHAFHESFGDVAAMLTALKDPAVVAKVAEQTNGDLTIPNIASNTGEQFGKAINDYVVAQGGPKDYTGGDYVRTTINPNLKWAPMNTLSDKPAPGNADTLSTEPHDLSRLWTCSVYEILGDMVKQDMAGGADAKTAISAATDSMLKIYGKMISTTSPEGEFTFADMAKAMVKADEQTGGKFGGLITKVMTDRQILPTVSSLMDEELPKGSYPATFSFTGNEGALKNTGLANLGGFSIDTVLSGEPSRDLVEDDSAKNDVADNVARWDRQGKILYTTPGQDPATIGAFQPNGEPYMAKVVWDGGQAKLERLPIFG